MAVAMEALGGRLLDGSVHPLDLAIGLRVIGLCEPVFHAVRLAIVSRTNGVPMARSVRMVWTLQATASSMC